jgi:ribosomal-protein-alanine N-acetyltransferase
LTSTAIEFPVEGLSDGVVRLRLPADADIPALVEACQDPAVQRFTTVPDSYGPEDARRFHGMGTAGLADGTVVHVVTVDAETDALLGNAGIRRHHTDLGRWDVGYLVAPWARGRGIALRAVGLLCRFGFGELGAERIEICAEPENTASLRVAEKAGFVREGLLREYQVVKGVRRDMVMFSLLRTDATL